MKMAGITSTWLANFDVRLQLRRQARQLASAWKEKYDYETDILNVGGGFGIHYTDQDHPLPAEEFVRAIVKEVKSKCQENNLKLPAIWIEPGRSIVGPAGFSLYTVGSRKDLPGYPSYVALDGGMGDKSAQLYQAKYSAIGPPSGRR